MKIIAVIAIVLIPLIVLVSAYFVWTKIAAPPAPEETIANWLETKPTILVGQQEIPVSAAVLNEDYTSVTIRDAQGNIIAVISMEDLLKSINTNQPLAVPRHGGGSSAEETITINGRVIPVSQIIDLGDVPVNEEFKVTDIVEETRQNAATTTIEAFIDFNEQWPKIRDYSVIVGAAQTYELNETIYDTEYGLPENDPVITFSPGDRRDVYFFVLEGVFKKTVYNPSFSELCSNDAWDGNESDYNCGGSCDPCLSYPNTYIACWANSDCYDNSCNMANAQSIEDLNPPYNDYNYLRSLAGNEGLRQFQGSCVNPNLPAHCRNDAWDVDESDLDCGGSCDPCSDWENEWSISACWTDNDCFSEYCYISEERLALMPAIDPNNESNVYNDYDSLRLLAGQRWIIPYSGTCYNPESV